MFFMCPQTVNLFVDATEVSSFGSAQTLAQLGL